MERFFFNENAMKQFMERTKAKCIIAPSNSPRFEDAALWFVNFYYHVLKQRSTPYEAYSIVKSVIDTNADFPYILL